MGVLDDAIREHLELKRQHGADPGEIKRQEDEALSEVVRSKSRRDASDDTDVDAEDHSIDLAQDAAVEPLVDQPTTAFDAVEAADALGGPVAPEQPLADEHVEADAHESEPEAEESELPEEPAAAAEPEAEEVLLEELEVDEEPAPALEPADELEETPEFLEDAPEHDKLWFEQKPPKDFEF